ncbi:MAG: bifunctional folylpolyglutamate synthase/dihydrofolate synthase [Ferrimicrobium sp.]
MSGGDGLRWLSQLLDFEADRSTAIHSPDEVGRVLDYLGSPHRAYPVIQIAGTNGKGTVAEFIEALLVDHGFRVGRYSSPDLCGVTERICVNSEPIGEDILDAELAQLESVVDAFACVMPTRFEALTIAAYSIFASEGCDVAVVETGLGGEADATNVASASVAVITSIGHDHLRELGGTIESITLHKVGIIAPESRVIIGEVPEAVVTVVEKATSGHETLWLHREIEVGARAVGVGAQVVTVVTPRGTREVAIPQVGAAVATNLVLAAGAVEVFVNSAVPEARLERAARAAQLRGRVSIVHRDPVIVVDVAHNLESVRSLVETLVEVFGAEARWSLVMGLTHDRDPVVVAQATQGLVVDRVAAVDCGVSAVSIAAAFELAGVPAEVWGELHPGMLESWMSMQDSRYCVVFGSHRLASEFFCSQGK